jgi:hypothetical protein
MVERDPQAGFGVLSARRTGVVTEHQSRTGRHSWGSRSVSPSRVADPMQVHRNLVERGTFRRAADASTISVMIDQPGNGHPRTAPADRLASGWREHLAVRLTALDAEAAQLPVGQYRQLAVDYLERARGAVERPREWRSDVIAAWTGTDIERAWVSTHAAEVAIVRASPSARVTAILPSLVEDCAAVIPKDPRVDALKKFAESGKPVDDAHHQLAADSPESAHATSDAQHVRVRSFRNLLFGTTVVLTAFVIIVGVIGSLAPGAFAVCGTVTTKGVTAVCPTGSAHPSGGDVFLVELLGLLAAAITGAIAIRKLSGTSTPYAVPLASLIVKLPIGALTALGGLLLIRAGFGPAITSLDQAQIIAYALVFGAAQQLFMQFVDKQAKSVLDATTTPGDNASTS